MTFDARNLHQFDYSHLAAQLKTSQLALSPAEMHGLLTGLLCAGITASTDAWLTLLYDYTHAGDAWPAQANHLALQWMHFTAHELSAKKNKLTLLLPDKKHSLTIRANALVEWLNAFISGYGLGGNSQQQLSKNAREILQEFMDIAQLETDENSNQQQQESYLAIILEHVIQSVCFLYAESTPPAPSLLH